MNTAASPAVRGWISAILALVLVGAAAWVFFTQHNSLLALALAVAATFTPMILRGVFGRGTASAER